MSSYDSLAGHKLVVLEAVAKRFRNDMFRIGVALQLTDIGYAENDLSSLTVHEVIEKIRDFVASNPSDENYLIFLEYLANYPVSMCKREVSPLLRLLIGMHYHLGQPNGENKNDGVKRITYDELAEMFGRSKATISECVHTTKPLWVQYQNEIKLEKDMEKDDETLREKARLIAMDELIEEEKEKLRKEKTLKIIA